MRDVILTLYQLKDELEQCRNNLIKYVVTTVVTDEDGNIITRVNHDTSGGYRTGLDESLAGHKVYDEPTTADHGGAQSHQL